MYSGFPLSLVATLRCTADGGSLQAAASGSRLVQGTLQCATCPRTYPVTDGIVSLLSSAGRHPESAREIVQRDAKSEAVLRGERAEWSSPFSVITEIEPMIDALEPLADASVLELGAGAGRLTMFVAARARATVAVDFSIASLRLLASKLDASNLIGLVHGDVTEVRVAPHGFDRVLSTLHSNLPTREHRIASNRLAAAALSADGRYVFGTHYYGFYDWLRRSPRSGHYAENGIYRYLMRRPEVAAELHGFFARSTFAPMSVHVPGVRGRLAWRALRRSAMFSEFSDLLLAVAERPIASPLAPQVVAGEVTESKAYAS